MSVVIGLNFRWRDQADGIDILGCKKIDNDRRFDVLAERFESHPLSLQGLGKGQPIPKAVPDAFLHLLVDDFFR